MKKKKGMKKSSPANVFRVKICVTLKKSVFDPQGKTVLDALHSLGFREAEGLRVGKFFDLSVKAKSRDEAEEKARAMCDKLLVNPVIEEFVFEIEVGK